MRKIVNSMAYAVALLANSNQAFASEPMPPSASTVWQGTLNVYTSKHSKYTCCANDYSTLSHNKTDNTWLLSMPNHGLYSCNWNSKRSCHATNFTLTDLTWSENHQISAYSQQGNSSKKTSVSGRYYEGDWYDQTKLVLDSSTFYFRSTLPSNTTKGPTFDDNAIKYSAIALSPLIIPIAVMLTYCKRRMNPVSSKDFAATLTTHGGLFTAMLAITAGSGVGLYAWLDSTQFTDYPSGQTFAVKSSAAANAAIAASIFMATAATFIQAVIECCLTAEARQRAPIPPPIQGFGRLMVLLFCRLPRNCRYKINVSQKKCRVKAAEAREYYSRTTIANQPSAVAMCCDQFTQASRRVLREYFRFFGAVPTLGEEHLPAQERTPSIVFGDNIDDIEDIEDIEAANGTATAHPTEATQTPNIARTTGTGLTEQLLTGRYTQAYWDEKFGDGNAADDEQPEYQPPSHRTI